MVPSGILELCLNVYCSDRHESQVLFFSCTLSLMPRVQVSWALKGWLEKPESCIDHLFPRRAQVTVQSGREGVS